MPDSYNNTPAALKANGLSSYNAYAMVELIHSSPQNCETLSVNWTRGKWFVSVEEMRYGSSVFIAAPNLPTNLWTQIQPAFITNMEIGYKITPQWRVAIGADNLGNKYPTRVEAAAAASNNNLFKYPTSSAYGYFGSMYYVNTSLNF